MADMEDYFPRGGKKPTLPHFRQSANFLGAPEKGERKKKKPKKKLDGDDGYLSDEGTKEIDQSSRNCANGINFKSIREGLVILGRVKNITDTRMGVTLPSRIYCSLMACHISEAYNKLLEAYVNDQIDKVTDLFGLFKVGQYIAVKVLEVNEGESMVSAMPQHVNSGTTHTDLQKGFLIQAAVSSVEDHGYLMDIGIPLTRAFLPAKHTNPDIQLEIGMLTWCTVKSVAPSADTSIVTLSNELAALQGCVLRRKPRAPAPPGTALDFVVDTPLEDGIEGHVFGDVTAYVQRAHAQPGKGNKPALGQKVHARLLYTMPTRNTPFLTTRNIFETTYPDMEKERVLSDGDIIDDAQVLRIRGRTINFKLGHGCVGLMNISKIVVHEDLTDEEVVANSYPIGSTHRVRVLGYHLSDYVYSVSDQPKVLNEKYFKIEQLSVGQIVDATVRSVAENNVMLNVGRIRGYVPHIHMFDSGIYKDPKKATNSKLAKKKYKVGQEVKARVWCIDLTKNLLDLTLKPSLLAPDLELLQSYEEANIGKAYTGVITVIRSNYILVTFFNKIRAFVPPQYVSKQPLDNIADAFHLGQIVNCTILKVVVETKSMTGSLTTAPFWPAKKREFTNKRQHQKDDSEEVPSKKQKNSEQTDVKENRKQKKAKLEEAAAESDSEIQNDSKEKKKRDKKEKKGKGQEGETEEQIDDKADRRKKTIKDLEKENVSEESTKHNNKKEKNCKNKLTKSEITMTEQQTNVKHEKKDKKKKHKEESKLSEESDAIETDFYEETDQVLNPHDLRLIDFSNCTTVLRYKKRIDALGKYITERMRRLLKIDMKITRMEEKGLDAKNKKIHSAKYAQKIVVEKIIKKLTEAMEKAEANRVELMAQRREQRAQKNEQKNKKSKGKMEKNNENEKATVKEEVKSEDVNVEKKAKKRDIKVVESLEPALEAPSAKDFWSANPESLANAGQVEESSSSEEEEQDQPKKKRKKLTVAEKLAKVREEEDRVREMEQRAISSESRPSSSEQFERALLANPNCSQLWIAYMAFHLQATEIEKARGVGRKALATISFREEQEKLNVWLAMINFENRFGTKESLQKTLEEAVQMNEPFKVHSKLLDMYAETSKHQELSALVDLMMRKHKREPSAYAMCGAACFKLGLVDKARQVMQKAMAVLEKKEHVSVLVQFALLERSHGGRERAEALFEQVLAIYPQRVDVAATYVDMLLKNSDADHIRQVMERMTSQKLPARKMKTLYKKWIEVEEKIGDLEYVEKIKQRAMDFIEKAKF